MAFERELRFARALCRNLSELSYEHVSRADMVDVNDREGIVGKIDKLTDEAAVNSILDEYPGSSIFSEEGKIKGTNDYLWIVDSLDGTNNYFRGKLGAFCTKVALYVEQTPALSSFHMRYDEEEFFCVNGEGSFETSIFEERQEGEFGECISVKSLSELSSKLTTVHVETNLHKDKSNIEAIRRLQGRVGRIHSLNCSGLEFVYVARGQSDACVFANDPYELAAGAMLVTGAGGTVTDFRGDPFTLDSRSIIASNGKIHSELVGLLVGVI